MYTARIIILKWYARCFVIDNANFLTIDFKFFKERSYGIFFIQCVKTLPRCRKGKLSVFLFEIRNWHFVSTAISLIMIALAERQREEETDTINFTSNEIHQPPRDSTSVFARKDSRGKRTQDNNRIERKRG